MRSWFYANEATRRAQRQQLEAFVPVLQQRLLDLLELLNLRSDDPNHGDEGHAELVNAVVRGDAEAAGATQRGSRPPHAS